MEHYKKDSGQEKEAHSLLLAIDYPESGGEIKQQLRDPFRYDVEDKMIAEWQKGLGKVQEIPFVLEEFKYGYADLKKTEKRP